MVIATVDVVFPHRFSTMLEVDCDTLYDRHITIEESHHYTRNKRREGSAKTASGGYSQANGGSLKEPQTEGLKSRILRRLSKREKHLRNVTRLDNGTFEMDPPKSPWRYPHLMHHQLMNIGEQIDRPFANHRSMQRVSAMAAQVGEVYGKKLTVVSFRRQSRPEPAIFPDFRRSDSQDSSLSSGASSEGCITGKRHDSTRPSGASSLGLSFLDRGLRMVPSGEGNTAPSPPTIIPISNANQTNITSLKMSKIVK